MSNVYGNPKRVIGGKTYRAYDFASSKAEAERLAEKRKKSGMFVRVIKLTSKYTAQRYGIYCAW